MTLVDRVHAALADCPRTAGELAAHLGVTRDEASKALATLVRRRRVSISEEPDPDTKRKIYEVGL